MSVSFVKALFCAALVQDSTAPAECSTALVKCSTAATAYSTYIDCCSATLAECSTALEKWRTALAGRSTPQAKCSAALTIAVIDNQLLSHSIGEIGFFISIAGVTGE